MPYQGNSCLITGNFVGLGVAQFALEIGPIADLIPKERPFVPTTSPGLRVKLWGRDRSMDKNEAVREPAATRPDIEGLRVARLRSIPVLPMVKGQRPAL
jgi:hypothetical protein